MWIQVNMSEGKPVEYSMNIPGHIFIVHFWRKFRLFLNVQFKTNYIQTWKGGICGKIMHIKLW